MLAARESLYPACAQSTVMPGLRLITSVKSLSLMRRPPSPVGTSGGRFATASAITWCSIAIGSAELPPTHMALVSLASPAPSPSPLLLPSPPPTSAVALWFR